MVWILGRAICATNGKWTLCSRNLIILAVGDPSGTEMTLLLTNFNYV